MQSKKYIVFALRKLISVCAHMQAQEVLRPLGGNAVLTELYKNKHTSGKNTARINAVKDTLDLPFIDDFSYECTWPRHDLWCRQQCISEQYVLH